MMPSKDEDIAALKAKMLALQQELSELKNQPAATSVVAGSNGSPTRKMAGPHTRELPLLPAILADSASDLKATAAEFVPPEAVEPSGALRTNAPVAPVVSYLQAAFRSGEEPDVTVNQQPSHRISREHVRESGHRGEDQSAAREPKRHCEHKSHRSRERRTSRSRSRERRGHREYGSNRARGRSASRSESRERRGKRQSRRRSRSRSGSRERGVSHRMSQQQLPHNAASLLPSDLYAAINDDGGTISTGPSSVAEVLERPFPRKEELAWVFAEQRRRRLFDGSMCVRMCTACHTHLHAMSMRPCTGA